jgi:hypothetical protein
MRLIARAVAAIVAATALGSTAAYAGPVLNYPTGTATEQQAIFHSMLVTINAADQGSILRIANPAMSWTVERALEAAHARGVKVRVILAGHAPKHEGLTDAGQRLVTLLGTNVNSGSFVRVCTNSCNNPGTRSIMHTKMLLASSAGGHPVTILTSVDLLTPLALKEWDNAIWSSDPDVFAHQRDWFNTMLDPYADFFPKDFTTGATTISNFPRPGSTLYSNYYTQSLAPVVCRRHGHATGTTVHLITSLWSPLLKPLAWRMVHMVKRGCTVRVILNRLRTPRNIVRILTDNHVPFRYSNSGIYHSHVKEIAVRGIYGTTRRSVVVSGTLNPSILEMKNCDESMFRITSDSVYDSFNSQFQAIWRTGNTTPLPASRSVIVTR